MSWLEVNILIPEHENAEIYTSLVEGLKNRKFHARVGANASGA